MKRACIVFAAACLFLFCLAATAQEDQDQPSKPVTVKLVALDDAVIVGSLYEGGEEAVPGVLLLPMMGRTRADYEGLARELQSKGIACLAVDLRGHGESVKMLGENPRTLDYKQFGDSDFKGMLLDVKAAYDFMVEHPNIDADHIGIVGASIGANAALIYAAENGGVKALVLLSPGLNYRGLKTDDAVRNLQDLKLMLAAAEDDEYSAETVGTLNDGARVTTTLKLYPTGGHGTTLMSNRPELAADVIKFLQKNL